MTGAQRADVNVWAVGPDDAVYPLHTGDPDDTVMDLDLTAPLSGFTSDSDSVEVSLFVEDLTPDHGALIEAWSLELTTRGSRCEANVANHVVDQLLGEAFFVPPPDQNNDSFVDAADAVIISP